MSIKLQAAGSLAIFALACSGGGYGGGGGSNSTPAGTVLATDAQFSATAGTPQSTPVTNPFATALKVTLMTQQRVSNGDGYGGYTIVSTPKAAASVTFTVVAGANGASGTFPGAATTATVTTDASGVATAPTLTANATAGVFTVNATTVGVTAPVAFTLTNN